MREMCFFFKFSTKIITKNLKYGACQKNCFVKNKKRKICNYRNGSLNITQKVSKVSFFLFLCCNVSGCEDGVVGYCWMKKHQHLCFQLKAFYHPEAF